MSYIVKLFTFDLYPNFLSFDGTNIFIGCVTGDLFLKYVNENVNVNENENKFKIKWCSTPYKETPKDIRKENYDLTNVAFFKETIVLTYKYKELWILTEKQNKWIKYDNPLMSEDEKYVYIKLFNKDFLLICTNLDDKYKMYVLDINKMILHDITDYKDTDDFNYDTTDKLVCINFTYNNDENCIAYTIHNNTIQVKHFNLKKITNFALSSYSKICMVYKNNELLTIPYSKLFSNSEDYNLEKWTKLDIKLNDPKEFITSIGVSESFYFVVTYKNIYAKKIEGENDWFLIPFTIPFSNKLSYNIKTVDNTFYDVTNIFWTSIQCYNNDIIIKNFNGKIYMVYPNDLKIDESLLPTINECYTNYVLNKIVFFDKYKIEYSEFECKCKLKH
jgi:hypothetical protein